MIRLDPTDVIAARTGDRAALARVVQSAERPVFNLAMRMLAHRADAEDATQEILIRLVTHLGTVEDPAAAGAWAMKVAMRHLTATRLRGRVEALRLSFEGFAADLDQGRAPLDQAELTDAEQRIAVEEVKIGCTLALLTCLSRDQRAAYVLADIYGMEDEAAAEIVEVTPATYRKRLSRARTAVTEFLRARCGVARAEAPCRCDTRVVPALAQGRITLDAGRTGNGADLGRLRSEVHRLEADRAAVAVMRSNPSFHTEVGTLVLASLERSI